MQAPFKSELTGSVFENLIPWQMIQLALHYDRSRVQEYIESLCLVFEYLADDHRKKLLQVP